MKKYLNKLTLISILLFCATSIYAQNPSDQEKMLQDMDRVMEKVQAQLKANPNMSAAEQKALVTQMMNQSKTGQDMLSKQKAQLPKILKILKSNRTCLSKADTKSDANVCEKKAEKLANKIGFEEDFEAEEENEQHFVWNKKEKNKILAEIDEEITHIEHSLPCIQKAKTMSDMMRCAQE